MRAIEASVKKGLARVDFLTEKIKYETIMTAKFLGHDSIKNEYWTFLYDPSKIYVKFNEEITDTIFVEKTYFYDSLVNKKIK